jgi:DNA-binding SARP family transcriptional activator/tetratricopeptide (TPR) repeat protein
MRLMSSPPIDGPSLRLAGAAQAVEHAGSQVPLALRDAALLAWLAIEGPTARTRLAHLFWPDSEPATGRNSLRQRLFQLKRQTGVALVDGGATLALARGVVHDLHDAESVLGDTRDAIGIEFDAWLALQRSRRQERVGLALIALCEAAERVGDWADALIHAGELLALDGLSEAAHCRLMRLHYLAGNRAAALLAFDRCEQVLKNEVGAAPSAATLELLQAIERSTPPSTALSVGTRVVPISVLRPPRRIGREAAWLALCEARDARRVVLLSGEAGMGKSRLLSDLAHHDPGVPPAVLLATARPGDSAVPYALLGRCLRALLNAFGLEPAAATRPLLARVVPELGEATALAGDEGRSRLVHAIEGLLAQAAGRGLRTLVVDDLQFADDASAELLAPLIASGHAGWVVAMRPAELSAASATLVDGLGRAAQVQALALQPLAVAQIAELLDSLAIAGIGGTVQAAELQQRTGGNPLYLLETLKAALTAAAPDPDGGAQAWAWPSAANVARLIQQRLARLSPMAMRVVRCAAVAGQDLSSPLVAHVLGLRPLDLADAWSELEDAQVLRAAAFAHDLIAEAALASVPEPIARPLHGEIAGFLEGAQGEPSRIASHWLAAARPLQAAPHLLVAARRAEHAWRLGEAADLYQRAGVILREAGQRRAAFEAFIAEAHMRSEIAVDHRFFACGQALEGLADDDGQRAMAALVPMTLLVDNRQLEKARQIALEALPLAQRAGLPEIESELLWGLAMTHWARREVADAVRVTERSLALLQRVDPATSRLGSATRERRRAVALGFFLSAAGRYDQSNARLIEVHRQARQHNDLGHMLDAAHGLAMNAIEQGDIAQALTWSADVVAGLERVSPATRAIKSATRATALAASGDLGAALVWFDRVEQRCDAGGARDRVMVMARRHLLHHELGRRDLAAKGLRSLRMLADLTALEQVVVDAARLFIGDSVDAGGVLEQVGRIDDLAVRERVLCLAQPGCEPARVLPLLDISLATARDCAAHGLWLCLQTRRVAALRAAGRGAEAAQAALAAWQRIEQGIVGSDLFPRAAAELCLALHPAHAELAQVIALRASSWMQRAASTLPPAWRENYLLRMPVLPLLQAVPRALPPPP